MNRIPSWLLLGFLSLSISSAFVGCGGSVDGGDPRTGGGDPQVIVPDPTGTPDPGFLAPSDLTAEPDSPTQITLKWKDNSDRETTYRIERKLQSEPASSYTEVVILPPNADVYSDIGLNPATAYSYRVRGANDIGYSPYSNEATATTLSVVLLPPSPPSNLTGNPLSQTAIQIQWSDNSSNETLFRIERKLATDPMFVEIATVGAEVTSFQDGGLTPNTTYLYRLRASNGAGDSPYSNEATVATLITIPAAPTDLVAVPGLAGTVSTVTLTWTDNANNEEFFVIERNNNDGGPFETLKSSHPANPSNVGTFVDSNVPEEGHCYRVSARNAGGVSAPSNEVCVSLVPADPSNLTGNVGTVAGESWVILQWRDNSVNETHFEIRYWGLDAIVHSQIEPGMSGVNPTVPAVVQNLAPSPEYCFVIVARNNNGKSQSSNQVCLSVP